MPPHPSTRLVPRQLTGAPGQDQETTVTDGVSLYNRKRWGAKPE